MEFWRKACYNICVKPLHKKKAVALYETRMRPGYVVKTCISYLFAAIIWYILAAVLPYTVTVDVSASENALITREAFSASAEQIAADESEKERALFMPSSEESFVRRLRLIADAKETVDQLIFDTYSGKYTIYYYTALLRAADRGVKIRVINDGKSGKTESILGDLEIMLRSHENIKLYYFNPVNLLDPAGLMTLMHDKLTIVDGDKFIIGGVNMGTSAYLENFDAEVMITNSGRSGTAGKATEYFEKMLSSELTEKRSTGFRFDLYKEKYYRELEEFCEKQPLYSEHIDYGAQGIAADKITFVGNPISAHKKAPIIWKAITNLMGSSKKSVTVTPYTLLQGDKKEELRRLAAKNDSFTLITNSLYNTRNVGYADYYYSREDYIDKNITLLEYQAKNQLHAKMFTFDDRFSVIGSFNMDERSAHIDTESVVVIDSPAFTARLNEYIADTFISNSLQVGRDNQYIPNENVKDHEDEIPWNKRALYAIYRAVGVVRCLI